MSAVSRNPKKLITLIKALELLNAHSDCGLLTCEHVGIVLHVQDARGFAHFQVSFPKKPYEIQIHGQGKIFLNLEALCTLLKSLVCAKAKVSQISMQWKDEGLRVSGQEDLLSPGVLDAKLIPRIQQMQTLLDISHPLDGFECGLDEWIRSLRNFEIAKLDIVKISSMAESVEFSGTSKNGSTAKWVMPCQGKDAQCQTMLHWLQTIGKLCASALQLTVTNDGLKIASSDAHAFLSHIDSDISDAFMDFK